MNINRLKSTFKRDGYVVIDNFFNDATMGRLDKLIRAYYGDNPDFSE